MAVISMVFNPALDPGLIMSKLYVPKPILGEPVVVFTEDVVSVVSSYSTRAAQILSEVNPMTVSCAYAGLNELGLAETYVKVATRPLATVAAWLTQDERVFSNILGVIE